MAETLIEKQHRFTMMIADLLQFADREGYMVTGSDWYRDSRCGYGHPASLHRLRLAFDINIFKDGRFLTRTEDHLILGTFWESMGGTWGGRWGDGNHYSLEHKGIK